MILFANAALISDKKKKYFKEIEEDHGFCTSWDAVNKRNCNLN